MRIIGVDFSGAQDQKKSDTWLAQGRLEGSVLTLETCHPIIRADLTDHLAALEGPAVVGMDFPFSVPVEFVHFCHIQIPGIFPDGGEMPGLWRAAGNTDWETFEGLALDFGERPLRRGDIGVPGAKSPLRRVNPDMLPMTFQGMQMLNRLRCRYEVGGIDRPLRILPLHLAPERDSLTLLEVMPGATLRSLNLLPAHNGYKGGIRALENRQGILTTLPNQVVQLGLNLAGLPDDLTQTCRANDDALDAVVAAITAALWAEFPAGFRHPPQPDHPGYQTALLEGWLYAPRILGGNE